jgi:hypothetical protein
MEYLKTHHSNLFQNIFHISWKLRLHTIQLLSWHFKYVASSENTKTAILIKSTIGKWWLNLSSLWSTVQILSNKTLWQIFPGNELATQTHPLLMAVFIKTNGLILKMDRVTSHPVETCPNNSILQYWLLFVHTIITSLRRIWPRFQHPPHVTQNLNLVTYHLSFLTSILPLIHWDVGFSALLSLCWPHTLLSLDWMSCCYLVVTGKYLVAYQVGFGFHLPWCDRAVIL